MMQEVVWKNTYFTLKFLFFFKSERNNYISYSSVYLLVLTCIPLSYYYYYYIQCTPIKLLVKFSCRICNINNCNINTQHKITFFCFHILVLQLREQTTKLRRCNLQQCRFHIYRDQPLKQMQNKQLANKNKHKPARDHPRPS